MTDPEQAPEPGPEQEPEQEARPKRRWLRWLLGLLFGVPLGLVVLVVIVVLAVLWIPAASQLAVETALGRWGEAMPGEVEWSEMHGSLGAGLEIEDFELRDAEARPLVRASFVELDIDVSRLLLFELELERGRLHEVEVWADHQWGDLAPPKAEPPEPKPWPEGYGPELPVKLAAQLEIEDGAVYLDEELLVRHEHLELRVEGEDRHATGVIELAGVELPQQDVQVHSLTLATRWDAPLATLERLDLDAPLASAQLLEPARFDAAELSGLLALEIEGHPEALADRLGLAELREHEELRLRLRGEGGPERVEVLGVGALDSALRTSFVGHLEPRADPETGRRELGLALEAEAAEGLLHPEQHALELTLEAELAQVVGEGIDEGGGGGFEAEAWILAVDPSTGEQLRLDARGAGPSLSPPRGEAELELRGPGLRARAEASSRASEGQRASLSLNIFELGEPLEILARYLDQPELAQVRGALALDASCRLAAEAPARQLRCPLALELDELSGYQTRLAHAELDGAVQPLAEAPSFDATLELRGLEREELELDTATLRASGTPEQLRVRGRGQGEHERFEIAAGLSLGEVQRVALDELELVSTRGRSPTSLILLEPARVVIGAERVEIHELRLRAGGGEVSVDGHLGLGGQTSALEAELDDVDLGRVAQLLPGPHMDGRVSAEASFVGSFERPAGRVSLAAEGLELAELVVDELVLEASLCGAELGATLAGCAERRPGDLQLRLRSAGPLVALVELDADLPLSFAGGFGLRRGRELSASLKVENLNLVELGGFMPRTPEWWRQVPADAAAPEGEPRLIPEGAVDLELALSGTAQEPRAELSMIARQLVLDRTDFGSALVLATLSEEGLGLEAELAPGLGTLELAARVPMELDLARQRFEWRREAEHRLVLELRGLELAALERVLGPKIPALARGLEAADLDGLVSATILARGPPGDPELVTVVRAHGLRHRGEPLGEARVLAHHREGTTEAELHLEGALAERLDARAELPLRLDFEGEGEAIWALDTTAPLEAELHVHGLELAALEKHVGRIPVDGEADLDLELDGSLADPELELAARLAELRLHADPIGDLTLRAELDREGVALETDLLRGDTHLAALELEIPLIIDLRDLDDARVAWDQQGHHRVLATGRQLDEELFAALTGRDMRVFQPDAADYGRGELDADLRFDIAGGGRLANFAVGGTVHGEIDHEGERELVVDGRLDLDEDRQSAELSIAPTRCERLVLAAGLEADAPALVRGEQEIGEVPFELELDAPDFQLETLSPLLPAAVHEPEGVLRAKLSGGGMIAAPELEGELSIEDGAITVVALRQRLEEIQLALALDNELIELEELALQIGGGELSGGGELRVRPGQGMAGKAQLAIVDVPIIRPGLPPMVLDSDVELELALDPEGTSLDVALSDPDVEVALKAPDSPKRIPSSEEVAFAGAAPEEFADEDKQPPADESAAADDSELRMRFELADPLLIHGPQVDMVWVGAVVIDRRGQQVELEGQLEAQRGRLDFLGHTFELRQGLVTLPKDGSLVPYLNIIAVTQTTEAEVTITIRGRATQPELHFSSNAALTEYQILTLLITGETAIGEGDSNVATKAAGLLAAVSNPQLQKQLDRYLGIDRARVGFGESLDQPILTLGKRVTRDVFVETTYHHNAPEDENTAEIGVEYNFARRWSLETFFGDAAVGGVGVYWTRTFGAIEWRDDSEDVATSDEPAQDESEAGR